MFTGQSCRVHMAFAGHLAGAVIDRFGQDVTLIPREDGFEAYADVVLSLRFYAWVFGFGGEAEILGPDRARQAMAGYLAEVSALYGQK